MDQAREEANDCAEVARRMNEEEAREGVEAEVDEKEGLEPDINAPEQVAPNADMAPSPESQSAKATSPPSFRAPIESARSSEPYTKTPYHPQRHHHSDDPAEEAQDLTSVVLPPTEATTAEVDVEDVVARPDEAGVAEIEVRDGKESGGEGSGAATGTATRTGQAEGSSSGSDGLEEDRDGHADTSEKALPALDVSEFDPFVASSSSSSSHSHRADGGDTIGTDSKGAQPPAVPPKPDPSTGSAGSDGAPRTPSKDSQRQRQQQNADQGTSRAQESLLRIEAQDRNQAADHSALGSDAGAGAETGAGRGPTREGRPAGQEAEHNDFHTQRQTQGKRRDAEKDEPVFNFSGFLRDLRTKPAEPIARYLKSFLTNFAKKPFTVNEQIKLIHDFLRFISDKMILYDPWKSQSPAELDNAMEAMEKLVMNRLYNYTFTPQLVPQQPITTDDLERDAVFAQRVRLFGWVEEKHLDVPIGEASAGFLGFAEQELLKINHYKAPRDKMICILNCCKVIFGLIRHTAGHGAGAEATSADAFVPILIYVVLKANPDNLLSNVEYINRFRSGEKLRGEAGYYLSSLSGAIAFIDTMDASSLSSITVEEFESNVEKAVKELPPSPTAVQSGSASRLSGGHANYPTPPTSARERAPGIEQSSTAIAPQSGEEAARALSLPSLNLSGLRFAQAEKGGSNAGPSAGAGAGAGGGSVDGDSTPSRALAFLSRTGEAAAEAVSRPLGAIGKMLEGIQVQDPREGSSGSEDGDDDEDDGGRRRAQRYQERQQRQPPTPQNAHRLHRPRGMDRAQTPDFYWNESPVRVGPGVPGHEHRPPPPHGQGYQQGYGNQQGYEDGAGSGMLGDEAFNFSRAATPMRDGPAEELQHTLDASFETHAQSQAQAQMRQANVQTLKQMFPALDEEVLEAVLQGSEEDLGLAIDRLLEM